MSAKPKPPAGDKSPPVIMFPLHGCGNVQTLTEAQAAKLLRKYRTDLRRHWTNPGVQALVSILEITTARLTAGAIQPGAGVHESGQAYGASHQLSMVRSIVTGVEEEASEQAAEEED